MRSAMRLFNAKKPRSQRPKNRGTETGILTANFGYVVCQARSNFGDFHSIHFLLESWFWPGAEDKALRGRNLSAVFRTLNRQVGRPCKRLPSCARLAGREAMR